METEVFIAGAGLSGLSAAYHLGASDYVVSEAEERIGGLCKSFEVDGFHFDCTGHVMHFRTEEGQRLMKGFVGDQIEQHRRKSAIFMQGRFTDYPFQANTYGLPPEIVKDCILGFVRTLTGTKKRRIRNFRDWILNTFGEGIARHFMMPYNEKLWQYDLSDIALDWVNWSIPKPDLEDVINGALGIRNREFGYNPVFHYPKHGGIGLLPSSIPVSGNLLLSNPVTSVNLRQRRVTLDDGRVYRYRYLLSTMPLPRLLSVLEDAPASFHDAREKLLHVSVLCVNLGIQRENVLPYHWVYFPEPDKPFYRVGSPSSFSSGVAPSGTSTLFAEVSLRPGEPHKIGEIIEHCIRALRNSRILREDDKIAVTHPVLLQHAYVIYNQARKKTVHRVLKYLEQKGIYSFGRYGSWIYSSMEDAVLQGKEYAEKVLPLLSSAR